MSTSEVHFTQHTFVLLLWRHIKHFMFKHFYVYMYSQYIDLRFKLIKADMKRGTVSEGPGSGLPLHEVHAGASWVGGGGGVFKQDVLPPPAGENW